jgi:hypothetical protein
VAGLACLLASLLLRCEVFRTVDLLAVTPEQSRYPGARTKKHEGAHEHALMSWGRGKLVVVEERWLLMEGRRRRRGEHTRSVDHAVSDFLSLIPCSTAPNLTWLVRDRTASTTTLPRCYIDSLDPYSSNMVRKRKSHGSENNANRAKRVRVATGQPYKAKFWMLPFELKIAICTQVRFPTASRFHTILKIDICVLTPSRFQTN